MAEIRAFQAAAELRADGDCQIFRQLLTAKPCAAWFLRTAMPHAGHGRMAHWQRRARRPAGAAAAGAQSLALHLYRHPDLYRRRRRGRGDRSRPRPARPCRRDRSPPPKASGSRRSSAPTPIATTARPAARSSAATGAPIIGCAPLRSRMTARAPTPRSISIMRPTACWRTASRLSGEGWTLAGGRDARPHLEPSLLRAGRERRLVHRRPCHGLVDHRGRRRPTAT